MKIIIPGKPIAKARPKFFKRGNFAGAYNPQETEEGKWLMLAQGQVTELIEKGVAVSLEAKFFFERPKGHFGTGKNAGVVKASSPEYHVVKPDCDNCIKFVKDCLNNVAWHDDSQVVMILAMKDFSIQARTELLIERIQK